MRRTTVFGAYDGGTFGARRTRSRPSACAAAHQPRQRLVEDRRQTDDSRSRCDRAADRVWWQRPPWRDDGLGGAHLREPLWRDARPAHRAFHDGRRRLEDRDRPQRRRHCGGGDCRCPQRSRSRGRRVGQPRRHPRNAGGQSDADARSAWARRRRAYSTLPGARRMLPPIRSPSAVAGIRPSGFRPISVGDHAGRKRSLHSCLAIPRAA